MVASSPFSARTSSDPLPWRMPFRIRSRRRPPMVSGPRAKQTERILLAAARVGQHVSALNVLSNCGQRCVFCGLNPGSFGGKRLLLAGHIKPWKEQHREPVRYDPRNGLAGCPSHDVAFDTGLLTVDAALQIHASSALSSAVRNDPLTRQYYGHPPLSRLDPPAGQRPAARPEVPRLAHGQRLHRVNNYLDYLQSAIIASWIVQMKLLEACYGALGSARRCRRQNWPSGRV